MVFAQNGRLRGDILGETEILEELEPVTEQPAEEYIEEDATEESADLDLLQRIDDLLFLLEHDSTEEAVTESVQAAALDPAQEEHFQKIETSLTLIVMLLMFFVMMWILRSWRTWAVKAGK